MSIPIAPTPILEGKNAKRFDRLVKQGLKKPVKFVPTPGLEEVKKKIKMEREIDYKKAFETAMKEIKSINTYVCKFCVARYYCLDKRHTKLCWGCIEEAIKRKCTKGGE